MNRPLFLTRAQRVAPVIRQLVALALVALALAGLAMLALYGESN